MNDVTYPLEMEVVPWQYNQHLIMEPDTAHASFAQHGIPLGTQ